MTQKRIRKLKFEPWLSAVEYRENFVEELIPFAVRKLDQSRQENIALHLKGQRCPFCQNTLIQMKRVETHDVAFYTYAYEACSDCGFWRRLNTSGDYWPQYFFPAVRKFDDLTETPSIHHLAREITINSERLYKMNPTKFERFVGSIMSEHFDCEVYHVGQSGDDGVDLVAINSDRPTLIQVKRRGDKDHREGVNTVKLLFASAFGRGFSKGMIVTTARDFTRPAKEWSMRPQLRDVKFEMNLSAVNDLMSLVDALAEKDSDPPWYLHYKRNDFVFGNRHEKWIHLPLLDGDALFCKKEISGSLALVWRHKNLEECTLFNGDGDIDAGDLASVLDFESMLATHGFNPSASEFAFAMVMKCGAPLDIQETMYQRWRKLFPWLIEELVP